MSISITETTKDGLVTFKQLQTGEVFQFNHDGYFYMRTKNHHGTANTVNLIDGDTKWTNVDEYVIPVKLKAEVV